MDLENNVCLDHWHCDPELAAHDCTKVNRGIPCPSCGESPLENMDGSWPDDLRLYAEKVAAREDLPENVRKLASRYATLKANAMEHRAAGRIQEALRLERQCDGIYDQLPREYHW